MAKKTENKVENKPEQIDPVGERQEANGTEAAQPQAEPGQPQETVQLSKEEFEAVRAHIAGLQKEREEAVALAQRLQADFDNYRKRNANLRQDSYQEGMWDCVKALLPTLDSFDIALNSMQDVDACFLDGMKLVQRMLLDALGKLGLQEVDASGAFDPNLHNAVLQEAQEGRQPGEILEVLQKGYEANGRILRHSMVKVAQ